MVFSGFLHPVCIHVYGVWGCAVCTFIMKGAFDGSIIARSGHQKEFQAFQLPFLQGSLIQVNLLLSRMCNKSPVILLMFQSLTTYERGNRAAIVYNLGSRKGGKDLSDTLTNVF